MSEALSNFTKMLNGELESSRQCPHCTIVCRFEFEIWSNGGETIRMSICPSCSKVVIDEREVSNILSPRPVGGGYRQIKQYGKWQCIFPIIKKVVIKESVPKEIKDWVNKINSIVQISHRDAAGSVRALCERILGKYVKVKGSDLKIKIEASQGLLSPRV